MSLMYMVAAMKTKVGNPVRKLVLLKLADNANDDGICWPSYGNIAEHSEASRRSVIDHCNALEKMGIISITNRPGEKGNSSNLFKLHMENMGGVKNMHQGGGESPALGVVNLLHPEPVTIEPVSNNIDHSNDPAYCIFWNAWPKKSNRKGAYLKFNAVFKRLCKEHGKQATQENKKKWALKLVADVQKRIESNQMGFEAMHATTYLNQERWNDEISNSSNGRNSSQTSKQQQLSPAELVKQQYRNQGYDV